MPQKHYYLQYNFLKIWGGVGVGVVFPFFFFCGVHHSGHLNVLHADVPQRFNGIQLNV